MANLPWFKFYGADYLLDPDVDAMPREAEALLVRMWCVCHREGSCPTDVESLARKTLCSTQYVSQCKPHCEGFFDLQDGRLYSRRMQEEKQRSAQARTNANKRYELKPESKSKSKSEPKSESESESERGSANRTATCTANGTAKEEPSDAGASSDSRHQSTRELIQDLHLQKFKVKCQWDGSEGKSLSRLLAANPSWTQEQITGMVQNHFRSEGVTGSRPRSWLSRLDDYTAGPLDRFNKLKGVFDARGNGKPSITDVIEREQAILRARAH